MNTICGCPACQGAIIHASDCAVHNEPAMPNGPCDCGVQMEWNGNELVFSTAPHIGVGGIAPGVADVLGEEIVRRWNISQRTPKGGDGCEGCGKIDGNNRFLCPKCTRNPALRDNFTPSVESRGGEAPESGAPAEEGT